MKNIFVLLCFSLSSTLALFTFPKEFNELSADDQTFLDSITTEQWTKSINFGIESVNRNKRLEEIIINSKISIQNGSLSHSQLLDTLPNTQAQRDNDIAIKILKSSLHAYNTICLENGINAKKCSKLLGKKQLPEETFLYKKCKEILQSRRDGHHAFRRLLPRFYKDAFYEMQLENENHPLPRVISAIALPERDTNSPLDDKQRNLALIQWAQFIEHDLSKPVVTSMSNGVPIECCNRENYNLLPRYRHSACAPLLIRNASYAVSCLNYVRSALAIGETCTFGAAEQLNQATGYLDLSQLYGFTKIAQNRMRTYKDGKIKSSNADKINQDLLPLATDEPNNFCAFPLNNSQNVACFMAGDSRVNSNPFSITIYTIFLRNHNRIAQELKRKHPELNDEQLYQIAKGVNIDIYRRIVYHEWLPEVVGENLAAQINTEKFQVNGDGKDQSAFHISNEFAVAAIRFYYSMMPDVLYNLASVDKDEINPYVGVYNNDILPHDQIFILRDQWYTPYLMYTQGKLNQILESILHQRSMKMDATYVSSLIPDSMGNERPTHADILAFDIQRGRDHGLQKYYKYLEVCNNVKINNWSDLENFLGKENINELQSVYANWTDIDLIIGGIAEIPTNDSTVGSTFACILAEQFAKIRQWQHLMGSKDFNVDFLNEFNDKSLAGLLCTNSNLKQVPKNVFRLPSNDNPMASCADHIEVQRG